MAGARRLAQLAKRVEALGRKRLAVTAKEDQGCCTSAPAKGHCVMYAADGRRFEVPLVHLGTAVFDELLRMSREEFGFTSDGKITLPCDAVVMEYIMCLLRRNASAEVEKAVLSSMVTPCHYTGCVMHAYRWSRQSDLLSVAAEEQQAQTLMMSSVLSSLPG